MSIGPISHSQNSVINAIASAATRTGADFDYLVRTATRESGLRTHANSSTSSAAGPFQFIEQTWLSTLKEHGGEHGLGAYSDKIEQGADGRFRIANAAQREEILALRHDARASALMAGELTNDASASLERTLGRELRENEPYVAHFMGLGGATRLIREVDESPATIASELFPRAANANPAIFNNADGSARTVAEVYNNLTNLPDAPISRGARGAQPTPSIMPIEIVQPAQHHAPTRRAAVQSMPSSNPAMVMSSSPGSYTSLLTPQVMEILATLDPSSIRSKDDDDDRSHLMRDV